MKARHKMMKRADGGKAEWYAGGGSNVAKEAEEKKKGGAVKKRKHGGEVEGHKSKMRLDKPGRKRGGGVGADLTPLSTASREKQAQGHTVEQEPD